MTESLIKALSNHMGWVVFAVVVALMIGPTGINRIIDRLLPPPESQAVADIDTKVSTSNRNQGIKLDQLRAQNERIIRDLRRVSDEMSSLMGMYRTLDARLVEMERWRHATLTPRQFLPHEGP